MSIIREGDQVLFYLDPRRTWLLRVEKGKSFHLHRGILDFNDVIGQRYGSLIEAIYGGKEEIVESATVTYQDGRKGTVETAIKVNVVGD